MLTKMHAAVVILIVHGLVTATGATAISGRKLVTLNNPRAKELRGIFQEVMRKICARLTYPTYCTTPLNQLPNGDEQFDKDIEYCLEETGYEEGTRCDTKAVREQLLRICEDVATYDFAKCENAVDAELPLS